MRLRGHHLICLHFYGGKGAEPAFKLNLARVVLGAENGQHIEITSGPDDVCIFCPSLNMERCSYSEDAEAAIREMDQKALELLGKEAGEDIFWQDIKQALPGIFPAWQEAYCLTCDWRSVCERPYGLHFLQGLKPL